MCKLHRTRYHLCTHPLTTSFTPCTTLNPSIDSPELCPGRTITWTHDISTVCPTCARDALASKAGLSTVQKGLEFETLQNSLPSPRLVELKRRSSVRGRGSMRESAEREKRRSQLLTPPLSRSPTFMQARHPRPPTPPPVPPKNEKVSKGENGLLTPPLPDTPTFLMPREVPKPPTPPEKFKGKLTDDHLKAQYEKHQAKRRTEIQIGCPSLGYTKVVVDDEEEKEERRQLTAAEVVERRIAALRCLEGRTGNGCVEVGGEVLLMPVAYKA